MSDVVKKVGRRRKHFKMEPDADGQAVISGTDKSFSCKYCGKGFGRAFGLSVHMRSHKKVKIKGTYKCPKCPKNVKEISDSVKYEVKPLSPSRAKPTSLYSCYVCHKKYTSAHSLRDHGRIHTGERPYPCNQCGQRFRVKQFLILHLRKAHADVYGGEESSGDLSWTAPVEEPMSNSAEQQPAIKSKGEDDLRANGKRKGMGGGGGGVPYTCPYCGKSFSYPSHQQLTVHTRVHTGERPFGCTQCGKRFARSGNLRAHQRDVHLGKRPFVCQECGKRFAHRGNLRVHHQRVHPGLQCAGVPVRQGNMSYVCR
uniref:C2H2-type domain-containing protein n=1 Tax=Salmo trutta TaxID=8032 RepID=A0A673WX46_SALTR